MALGVRPGLDGWVVQAGPLSAPQLHDDVVALALHDALDVIAPARERGARFLDQGIHLINSADPAIHT